MKKKVMKIVYRVIPCLVCVMIVISSLTMPAQAAGADWTIDYNDYISDLEVDGENGIVTVRLPREFYLIKLFEYFGSQDEGIDLWWSPYGGDLSVNLIENVRYCVIFYSDPHKPFYLGNIPDDATVTVSAFISNPNTSMYGTPMAMSYFNFWDQNGNWLAQKSLTDHMQPFGEKVTVSSKLNKDIDGVTAYAGVFGIEFFNLVPLENARYTFHFEDLLISFPISALAADKIMNDQNQALIKGVKSELEKQNKTLESILNGTPEMNDQVSNAVGGMQSSSDKLGELGESMKVEQPDVSGIKTDLAELVDFNAVKMYVAPFLQIWDNNSTLFSILTIVLTLVIISWVMFGKKG